MGSTLGGPPLKGSVYFSLQSVKVQDYHCLMLYVYLTAAGNVHRAVNSTCDPVRRSLGRPPLLRSAAVATQGVELAQSVSSLLLLCSQG